MPDTKHLTEALRRAEALGIGSVRQVEVLSMIKKLRSNTLRLRLEYRGSAEDAPNSVILKMGHLGDDGRPSYVNRREITLYRDLAPTLPERLVPRCFDIGEATATSAWHLLLEDLTDTHFIATEHPLPPTLPQCTRIVRAWARLHAAWWDDPRLGILAGKSPKAVWKQYLRNSTDRFGLFIDHFGEVMPAERRRLYERLLDMAPRLLARYDTGRNLTLIHGDAHWWNCFLSRNDRVEDVRLIDIGASARERPTLPT